MIAFGVALYIALGMIVGLIGIMTGIIKEEGVRLLLSALVAVLFWPICLLMVYLGMVIDVIRGEV